MALNDFAGLSVFHSRVIDLSIDMAIILCAHPSKCKIQHSLRARAVCLTVILKHRLPWDSSDAASPLMIKISIRSVSHSHRQASQLNQSTPLTNLSQMYPVTNA
jgi:hypothetical protein